MTAWRCALMVRSEVPSSCAICLFSLPRTTSAKTWLSRGVRLATSARRAPSRRLCRRALFVAHQRALDRFDQGLFGNRLRQEVLGAGLDGPDAGWNIAMAGQEDDRQGIARRDQASLQFGAAQAGHPHVEQDASGRRAGRFFQEPMCRVVERDLISGHPQQPGDRGAKRLVVVNDVNDWRVGHHAVWVLANGRVKRNTAPPPVRFSAQILPP